MYYNNKEKTEKATQNKNETKYLNNCQLIKQELSICIHKTISL